MKRATHLDASPVEAGGVISLTSEIVRSAKEVVSFYDRVDWESLGEAECDMVHLHFQSAQSVEVASQVMTEMAAGNPGLRDTLIYKIRKQLQGTAGSATSNQETGARATRDFNGGVEELLSALVAERNPAHFAKLCRQAWVLHCRVSTEVWEERPRQGDPGSKSPPPPPPALDSIPCWLGPAKDLWLGVPIKLAFAEPVVGFCRRIAEINTGASTICFDPAEEDSLCLHHRLWEDCRPCSCRIPVDDFSHPICSQTQKILNSFLPKLRRVVRTFTDQCDAARCAEVASTSLPQREERVKPEGHTQIAQVAEPNTPGASHRDTPNPTSLAGAPPSSGRTPEGPVLIRLTKDFVAYVPSRPELTHSMIRRRALLALAALAGDQVTEFHLKNTADFVALTHPQAKRIPHQWGRDGKALGELDIEVKLEGRNEYHLRGFKFEFDQTISREAIRDRVLELAPRSRRRRRKTRPSR